MSRNVRLVPYQLKPLGVVALPFEEIEAILRGADMLIATGGRTMLVKILKGSRIKRLLELGYDSCPVYGYYNSLKEDEILARVDWMIVRGFLDIEYSYRLPMLVYTPRGWEIEKRTRARELLLHLDAFSTQPAEWDPESLLTINREVITLLLDQIVERREAKYIPFLRAWQAIEVRKMRARLQRVIDALSEPLIDGHK